MQLRKGRKLQKILQSLANSGVSLSDQATNVLFVSNSSVLVGVFIESLEELFHAFDPNCTIFVYPNYKSYSFVKFSTVLAAEKAKEELDGTRPANFPAENTPILLLFVDKLPESSNVQPNKLPAGLKLQTEFMSEQIERELMEFIERRLEKSTPLKNRRVLHFGHKFNYKENNALELAEEGIPTIFDELIDKILDLPCQNQPAEADYRRRRPNQVTVNVYEPGQGIPPHTDTHSAFAEPIWSLSLGSDVVMEFRDGAFPSKHVDVLLPPRSLMEMRREARYCFKHCIMSRKYDVNPHTGRLMPRKRRMSITFRLTSSERCQCPFPEFCDWDRGGRMRVPDSEAGGERLEREYVGEVYERIADHFDQTRHSTWAGVTAFLDSLQPGSLLLDIGCGNGKYLHREDQLVKFGCDLSTNLLRISRAKGCSSPVFRADALGLPVRDASFDAAISIAVVHHFSTRERRRRAIGEILRVLRPGGLGCVTAWAFEQKAPVEGTESIYVSKMRANKASPAMADDEEEVEDHGRGEEASEGVEEASDGPHLLRVHDGRHFGQQDLLVPWGCPGEAEGVPSQHFRYYHLFARGELAALVREFGAGEVELLAEDYDEGNWVVLLRRRA